MQPTIRDARDGDETALALVGAATFLESYAGVIHGDAIRRHCLERHAPAVYADALADPAQALILAELDPGAAPVGYVHLGPVDLPVAHRPDDLEMKRIYALSRLHGTGLGARLMQAGLDRAAARGAGRLLLGVYKGNARALRFYARFGFETVGERDFEVGGRTYQDWVLARPAR